MCVNNIRMSDVNLSAVVYGKDDLRLEDRPIPEPGPGEVQIAVQRVGVCGSDIKTWSTGRPAVGDLTAPTILGHEVSGIVSKRGSNVKNLNIGDRVAMDPHITCRLCEFCKVGKYPLCEERLFLGRPPYNGGLTRYLVHAADFVFKLPDNVSLEEGAMVEPLSVALNACRRVEITMSDRVLITGAGPIGLCCLLVAKAHGASAVCLTDIDAKRLAFAKSIGATHTYLISKDDNPEDISSKITKMFGGAPHHTIECSAAQFSIDLAIYTTGKGGSVAMVGISPSRVSFPFGEAFKKSLDLKISLGYVYTWPTIIDMISTGQLDVKPLITHTFTLEDTIEAFNTAKSGKGIKVIVDLAKK